MWTVFAAPVDVCRRCLLMSEWMSRCIHDGTGMAWAVMDASGDDAADGLRVDSPDEDPDGRTTGKGFTPGSRSSGCLWTVGVSTCPPLPLPGTISGDPVCVVPVPAPPALTAAADGLSSGLSSCHSMSGTVLSGRMRGDGTSGAGSAAGSSCDATDVRSSRGRPGGTIWEEADGWCVLVLLWSSSIRQGPRDA